MLQDIYPWKLDNTFFSNDEIVERDSDLVLDVNDGGLLSHIKSYQNSRNGVDFDLPTLAIWKESVRDNDFCLTYAYRLLNLENDNQIVFRIAINRNVSDFSSFLLRKYSDRLQSDDLRVATPNYLAFAGMTGLHLYNWINTNKYCGKCGNLMKFSSKSRALICISCGHKIHPAIAPCVIVAVTNKDSLLLTTYTRHNLRKYVLVAGFVEIGESAEDAAVREVMEETGLRIKNLRYYATQPWGAGGSLAIGFIADVDGDASIRLDKRELSAATWTPRSAIPDQNDESSMTMDMLKHFAKGDF